jgi:hypothetical protein
LIAVHLLADSLNVVNQANPILLSHRFSLYLNDFAAIVLD